MTLHLTSAGISTTANTPPSDPTTTPISSSSSVKFKTTAYAFCNPCNDAFEFIVCTHTSLQPRPPPPQPLTTMNETAPSLMTTNTSVYSTGGQPMSLIDPNSQYVMGNGVNSSNPYMMGAQSHGLYAPQSSSSSSQNMNSAAAAAAAAAVAYQMSMQTGSNTNNMHQYHTHQQPQQQHHDGSPTTPYVGNYLMMSSNFNTKKKNTTNIKIRTY